MNSADLSLLSIDRLVIFTTVVERGSFSAAARALGRAQSAVSYAIAQLEGSLELALFDRSAHRPTLTAAGEALLPEAREVLRAGARLLSHAADWRDGAETEVSLVVEAICPPSVLVEVGHGFHARFPGVSLRVDTDVLGAVTMRVRQGSAVLGLTTVDTVRAPLELAPAGRLHMVAVAAPTHALALADDLSQGRLAAATQIVIAQRGPSEREEERGVVGTTIWRVGDAGTKRELIVAGMGWGRLPASYVAEDLDAGRLVALAVTPKEAEVRLSVVSRSDHPLGPAARWLRDALIQALEDG